MRLRDRSVGFAYRHGFRGTGRAAAALYGDSPLRTVRTTLDGHAWEADPLDWMDVQLLRDGAYEPEVTSLLRELLEPGGVLWDVGANSGYHCVPVAIDRPDTTVVAFEPSPIRFALLLRNINHNSCSVQAFCIALADERGYRSLSVATTGNSGHTSLIPWADVAYDVQMSTWCDTGDAMLDLVARPSVLKIDVEGAEAMVLGGMDEALTTVRHVVFEAADVNCPAAALLQARGFNVTAVAAGRGGGLNFLASSTPG